MKSTFKRLLSSVLSVTTLASTMPLESVFAEDTREDYPYTLFASSNAEGAITIETDNFSINGEIATNGTVLCTGNNNVNTSKNEQICAEMVYIPNRIEEDFFSGYSVKEIEGDYDLSETNININSPMSVGGITELTGNINIHSGIKSKDDIILSGDVQNSEKTVIYSQYGNIDIDCNNVNLNGLIYAPFGNVHIKAGNLNMNNTMIIADTITIEAPNVNVNYSKRFSRYFGEVSDKMEISEEDYKYFTDEDENGLPDFFERSINWKYLTDTDGDGVPDIIELHTGSDPNNVEDDYNQVLDSYTLELMYKNPLILYKPQTQELMIYGDMDKDQIIDVFDLVLLRRACINGEFYEEGDLDGDGDLDADDIKYLQDFLLTKIKCYPVYNRFDTDDDGLTDYMEIQFTNTSPHKSDTDGDGLSDYFEAYLSGTDPNVVDKDTSIDSDGDKLTLLQESKYNTNPNAVDTDNDGLSDYDEVITYGTDPLNIDSDGDGLTDKEEVIDLKGHNLDPVNPATNGTPDGERILTQIIPADSSVLEDVNTEDNAYNLSLIVNASGNAANALSVVESGYSVAMKDGSAVGFIPEFFYDPEYSVQDITLKFEIKEEYRESVLDIFAEDYDDTYDEELDGIKRFNIFKYFEEIDSVMPIDTEYDVENNTVYVTITSDDFEIDDDGTNCGIGSYSLVDLEIWGLIMNENCADIENEEETVQAANASPQRMYAPNVNILANEPQQVSKSALTRSIEIVAKIMRNYYSFARVNTPETSTSSVVTYHGHKYSVINGQDISWSSAEAACEAMGGHLMTPSSAGEFALLQTVLTHGSTYNHYWLGAYKDSSGWMFVNDEGPVSYIDTVTKVVNGRSYYLNDFGIYIGSNLFYADGMSYYYNRDRSCTASGYICEWDSAAKYTKGVAKAATTLGKAAIRTLSGILLLNGSLSKNSNIDTDGDGIPDYQELNWKLMNKVAPGATGASWLQTYNWLLKNNTSKGLVKNNNTSSKVNKAVSKTSSVSTAPATAGTQPVLQTTTVAADDSLVDSDKDKDYLLDGDDPNKRKFNQTEIPLGIIDDSEMFSKKIVLRSKDTNTTTSVNQRELMSSSAGGGVTEIMELPGREKNTSAEKAAINYKRDHNHKVEFLIDNIDKARCFIAELEFSSSSTRNTVFDNNKIVKFARANNRKNTDCILSKEKVGDNKIKYTLEAVPYISDLELIHKLDYILDIDSSKIGSEFSVKIYEETYVYAPYGAITYKGNVRVNNAVSYTDYQALYLDEGTLTKLVKYEGLIKLYGEGDIGSINSMVADKIMYCMEHPALERYTNFNELMNDVSKAATYASVPLIFVANIPGAGWTILGIALTVLGAGSTAYCAFNDITTEGLEKKLEKLLNQGNMNVYLESYNNNVEYHYLDGTDVESGSCRYFDAEWNSWDGKYINRIIGNDVLNVGVNLKAYDVDSSKIVVDFN